MTFRCFATLLVCWLTFLAPHVQAQAVVGWRSDGSGVFPGTTPPTRWSQTENVRWFTELPGRSNAQPIIVGDRVFLCAEPFTLLCLNRLTPLLYLRQPLGKPLPGALLGPAIHLNCAH